jgi:hypothetical protein
MQKKVVQGIPFWIDAQNRAFVFETKELPSNPLWLGTYNPQTEKVELLRNWREAYAQTLEDYHKKAAARARVPQQ